MSGFAKLAYIKHLKLSEEMKASKRRLQ